MKSSIRKRPLRTPGHASQLRLLVFAVAAIVAASRVSADGPQPERGQPAGAKTGVAQLKLAVLAIDLNKPIRYEFKETKLRDVLTKLAADNHVGFWLETPTLADAEVTDAFPITAKGDGEALQDALHKILAPTFSWEVYDDVIFVRTPDMDCFPPHELRVYKLLRPGNPDALIEKITSDICPETWNRVGGGAGEIAPWANRALLVSQTPRILRLIEKNYTDSLLRVDDFGARPIPQKSKPDAALLAKLNETVDCDFDEATLGDVMKYLSTQCKLPIRIDEGALKTAGIKLSSPITGQLHGVRLELALNQIEKMFGVAWFVDPSGVQITAENDKKLTLVSYDVRDLSAAAAKPDSLVQIIKDWICAASWESNGGIATIAAGGAGTLEVRQTKQIHRHIEQLLATLRRASR